MIAFDEDREAAANKHHTMSALAKALAPRPIVELAGRIWLSDRDRARLFDQHDGGDEDPKARAYGRIVCGRRSKAGDHCDLRPHHFGPCDWERVRVEIDPSVRLVLKPFNKFAIVTDEQLAEAARADLRFSPHDGEG